MSTERQGGKAVGERWAGDTERLLDAIRGNSDAIRSTAQITKDLHERNESRLATMERQLQKHTGMFDQYLIKQEAWERLQQEFSGSNSFYVQLSMLKMELTRAKEVVTAIQIECATELKKLIEGRQQREEEEEQRKRDHENNSAKVRLALIAAFGTMITSISAILLEIFKK